MRASTSTATDDGTGTSRLERIRRYRRLMYGSLGVGIAGFVGATAIDRFLLGVAVYWLGFLGFLAVWKGTCIELFDERDRELEARASGYTLGTFAVVLVFGWPTGLALQELGYVELPAEFVGAVLGYAALYAAFGAVYAVVRYRG